MKTIEIIELLSKATKDGRQCEMDEVPENVEFYSDNYDIWKKNEYTIYEIIKDIMTKYRIKPEPRYRPFTQDDWRLFKDLWVRPKNSSNSWMRIVGYSANSISLQISYVIYSTLLNDYETNEGKPCGVEI